MKILKKYKLIILSILIVSCFMLSFIFIKGIAPFGNYSFVNGDCYSYIYPLLTVFHRKLTTGDSMLYYWNAALGYSFLPTYFYGISSPLYFFVLFFSENSIRSYINISIVVRIILSSGTFSIYLYNKKNEDNRSIYLIPLTCAYSLSGFILGYYNQSMWLDSYAILPIIILGYNRMMKEKKPAVYIISLVCSAFSNFFMTYMIGIFLIIWFILDNHDSLKCFFKDFLFFISNSLLAICMSAFSLMVTFMALFNTRVGDSSGLSHRWFDNTFNIINNFFFLSKPIDVSGNDGDANVYCGLFAVVFLFVYFIASEDSFARKAKKLIAIILLIISMNESVLNYFWHGFHFQNGVPNRFSFILIFMVLDLAYDALLLNCNVKKCVIALVIAEVFPLVAFCIKDFNSFIDSKIMVVILLGVIIIYAFMFLLDIKYNRGILKGLFSIIMMTEVFIQALFSLNYTVADDTFLDSTYEAIKEYKKNSLEDSAFVRSKVIELTSSNNEMLLDLNGAASFDGFNGNEIKSFLESFGYFVSDSSIEDKGIYKPIDDILGFKTIYSVTDSYIGNCELERCYGNDIFVYNNDNALSLGFTIESKDNISELTEKKYTSDNPFNNINSFVYDMTEIQDIYTEIYPEFTLSGKGYSVNIGDADNILLSCHPSADTDERYINVAFVVDQDGDYNISLLCQKFNYVIIYVNGKCRRNELIGTNGVLGLGELEKGDKVDIVIGDQSSESNVLGDVNEQFVEAHLAIMNYEKYDEFINCVSENQMKVDLNNSSRFNGSVNIADNQLLITSIPYDDGWHVYENGKELPKKRFVNSFIMLELGEGNHELEFRFIPKGFYLGIAMSLVSWMVFIFMILGWRKNENNKR